MRSYRELPALPFLPVLGSLPWIVRPEGFVERLQALGENYREFGAFRVRVPGQPERLFVLNADMATDLCDENKWEKVVDGPQLKIRDFAGDGLFTAFADEPNWGKAHRLLAPGFSNASMDRYFPAMVEVLNQLTEHWSRKQGPVDVVRDMTKMTLDTISVCGFDHRFSSFEQDQLHPFLVALQRALQESIDSLIRLPFLEWAYVHKKHQHKRDIQTMFALVDDVIAARKKLPASEQATRKDFLALMLGAVDTKTGEKLSDENIRYQILTFLIAGHETTSGLLSFVLHALARDPKLFGRIREEADRVLGEGEVTLERVMRMDLILRTLSEGLRLWPTVPIIDRRPKEDASVGGFMVPAGMTVGFVVGSTHRDPKVWDEPKRFDPDRFLPEASKNRPAGAYKPFGVGKRACIGKQFALLEAALCIGVIARKFDLEDPGPLVVAPTVSPKPGGFLLRVHPRR